MVQPGQRQGDEQHADPGRHQLDGVRGGGRTLQGGPARQPFPAEDVVQGVQHDLVGEVPDGDLVGRGDEVIPGDQHDRGLGVEGDGAEQGPVDGQPHQSRVGVTVQQHAARARGGDLGQGKGDAGQPLVPDAHPFVGRHPRDVREPERGGSFRACHPARLPGVVGSPSHDRYP